VETLALAAAFLLSILSPMAAMARGLGPMKTMPALLERDREGLALGQEAVARMHGLAPPVARQASTILSISRYDCAAGGGPMATASSAHLHVQAVPVGVGIDSHRRDAELGARF